MSSKNKGLEERQNFWLAQVAQGDNVTTPSEFSEDEDAFFWENEGGDDRRVDAARGLQGVEVVRRRAPVARSRSKTSVVESTVSSQSDAKVL